MKSIKYILLAIMLSSIIVAAIPKNAKSNRSKNVKFILECVDGNAKKEDLVKSVIVYKERLNAAGVRYKIGLKDDNTIKVVVKEKDSAKVKELLYASGSLGFYLPYLNQDGIKQILKNDKLVSLYNGKIVFTENSESILLSAWDENKSDVECFFINEVMSQSKYSDLVIAWSKVKNEADMWELYLLTEENYLDGSYVEKSYSQSNENMGGFETMIVFSDEGAKFWADLTGNNVSRNLAIVLDGEVYSAPRIMSEIFGGKALISGDFTEHEAKQLAALIQSGELPLEFKIKE